MVSCLLAVADVSGVTISILFSISFLIENIGY